MNKLIGMCLQGVLIAALAGGCGLLPDKAMTCPADQVIYCGFRESPRVRYGTYPCVVAGTPTVGPDLGQHSYYWSPAEKGTIAYTCRAGHVDTVHLRIAADWTAYLTAESYRHLMKGQWQFSYKGAVDRSRDFVQISYPRGWDRLPHEQRSAIAREVAMAMGPYLAYTMVTWHEILTWYGYKCVGLPVEFASAFSWEDSFSNLLGTRVAARALQDKDHPYNEAVKIAIDEQMQELGIQPADVARQASDRVKGRWFTGEVPLFVDIKKRNFDIGLENGTVMPTLVPGEPSCPGAEPVAYPAPTLDVPAKYGFAIHVEIEPHEWEKDAVLCAAGQNCRIDPQAEYPVIMDHLRRQAAALYGPEYSPDRDEDRALAYRAK